MLLLCSALGNAAKAALRKIANARLATPGRSLTVVSIDGLVSRTDLNGRRAVVLAATGRVAVEVIPTGERVLVKPTNLRCVPVTLCL